MSKAGDIRSALIKTRTDAWQCKTCQQPAREHSLYCFSCELYWDDVSNGLFDEVEK